MSLSSQLKQQLGKFRRRVFAPRNSLIVSATQLASEGIEELERSLDELASFYAFVKLTDLTQSLKRGDISGFAAVVVPDVRNEFMRQWTGRFIEREIPLTLFLRTSCVGLNRLPLEEELVAFREAYPERVSQQGFDDLLHQVWSKPSAVEEALGTWRKTIGPLPVQALSPLQFFTTWGRILEVPDSLRDWGIVVDHDPTCGVSLDQQLTFIRQQTGQQVRIARSKKHYPEISDWAQRYGIDGWVVDEPGIMERHTDLLRLPIWQPA